MNDGNATQLLATLVWRDPRVRLLDDTWLVTIFAVLFATAVPWLVSGLAIDFIATAAGLITLGAIHLAFVALSGHGNGNQRRRSRTLIALHSIGVIAIAYIAVPPGVRPAGDRSDLPLALAALRDGDPCRGAGRPHCRDRSSGAALVRART
jgi:hypothetical protein